MFDPNTLKNIKDIEEAVRMGNSLSGVPISELTHSAAHLASTANHIDIQNIAAMEKAVRVQNSAAARAAEMLAEHVRMQNPAVPGLTAVPSLSGLPISELVDSAARLAGMADQIGTKNIEAVIERTGRIAASIIDTMPALPALTPATFGFVPGGQAEQAWKGFSDQAAALAGGEAAGEESVQALLEDAATVATHTPAESKEKAESLIRAVLINVLSGIIAYSAIEGAKALWPLLITLLTCVPLPKPPPPMPKPPPSPPALMEEAPPSSPALLVPGGWRIEGLPGLIREAGPLAEQRLVEFFTAEIRNPNTRQAYAFATARFFEWCESRNLALASITPFAVAAYIEGLQDRYAQPTVKQHLAAIRTMFGYLVVGQVLPVNPAASVRGPKHVVKKGKTPVLTASDLAP